MEEHLIAEVAKFPILYDTTREEYKHVELKNAAWREIAMTLFSSANPFIVEKVKNKWKNLRDTFVKSQRKKNRANSRPWKLEAEMKFLIPHLNPKLTNLAGRDGSSPYEKLSMSSPESPSRENILESYIKREEENECSNRSMEDSYLMQHVEAVMEDSPKVTQRKRRRESFKSDSVKHFLDISEQLESPLRVEQAPFQYDAIDSYFLGLAQTVKRLKPVNQVLLKKEISILVFDAELKETTAACESPSSSGNKLL